MRSAVSVRGGLLAMVVFGGVAGVACGNGDDDDDGGSRSDAGTSSMDASTHDSGTTPGADSGPTDSGTTPGTDSGGGSDGSVDSGTSQGTITTLATGQNDITDLVVDSTSIYWTTRDGGGALDNGYIAKMPLDGGAVTTLVADIFPSAAIAVQGDTLYFTSNVTATGAGIGSVPIAGGATTAVVPADEELAGVALTTSATAVYWLANDTTSNSILYTAPIAGGSATKLYTGTAMFIDLAIDAINVYWTTRSSPTGSVKKIPLGGGTVTTMVSVTGAPMLIATDGVNVYWGDESAQTVSSVPVGGGTPTTLASDANFLTGNGPVADVSGLFVEGSTVYWSNSGSSELASVPTTDGGTPTNITATPSSPNGLVHQGTSLFWYSGDGKIFKWTPH